MSVTLASRRGRPASVAGDRTILIGQITDALEPAAAGPELGTVGAGAELGATGAGAEL